MDNITPRAVRKLFIEIGEKYNKTYFKDFTIMASNEIHEDVLYSLNKQGHEINSFGIGTNLITCLKQPSLGMVYKLVSINEVPRLKLSEDIGKVTLPGLKSIYRVSLRDPNKPSFDLIALRNEPKPEEGKELEVIDHTQPKEKLIFKPSKIELMNTLVFEGKVLIKPLGMKNSRELIFSQLDNFDQEIIKSENPKPYPVYYSVELYKLLIDLFEKAKNTK